MSARSLVALYQSVAVLPSQLPARSGAARSPEMRLVAAMFEDALRSVLRNANARRGPRRREFEDACEWLLDDSRDWPFAFANVCDLLGLDATAVRQSSFDLSEPLQTRTKSAGVRRGEREPGCACEDDADNGPIMTPIIARNGQTTHG